MCDPLAARIAFRTQILNIVTGGGAVSGSKAVSPATGVFFPNGMNAGPNGFQVDPTASLERARRCAREVTSTLVDVAFLLFIAPREIKGKQAKPLWYAPFQIHLLFKRHSAPNADPDAGPDLALIWR